MFAIVACFVFVTLFKKCVHTGGSLLNGFFGKYIRSPVGSRLTVQKLEMVGGEYYLGNENTLKKCLKFRGGMFLDLITYSMVPFSFILLGWRYTFYFQSCPCKHILDTLAFMNHPLMVRDCIGCLLESCTLYGSVLVVCVQNINKIYRLL